MSNHEENTLTLWRSEDMVRAVILVNEGMTVSEAAGVYSVHREVGVLPTVKHRYVLRNGPLSLYDHA